MRWRSSVDQHWVLHPRERILEYLDALHSDIDRANAHAGDVPAGSRETGHETDLNSVVNVVQDDGDRRGRLFRCDRRVLAMRDDHIHLTGGKVCRGLCEVAFGAAGALLDILRRTHTEPIEVHPVPVPACLERAHERRVGTIALRWRLGSPYRYAMDDLPLSRKHALTGPRRKKTDAVFALSRRVARDTERYD